MSYDKSTNRNRRAALTLTDVQTLGPHECAAPGCHEMISRQYLMCAAHWFSLPADVRHAVYRTYRNGGAGAYLAARNAAIEAISGGQS